MFVLRSLHTPKDCVLDATERAAVTCDTLNDYLVQADIARKVQR